MGSGSVSQIKRASAELRKWQVTVAPASDSSPGTVGLVGDDAELLDLFERRLRRLGYSVKRYVHDRGVDALLQRPPDVLLVDLGLPPGAARQLLTRVRKRLSLADLPILVLSDQERSKDVSEALRLGASDFLIKGGNFTLLHARLRAQLMLRLTFEALGASEARHNAVLRNLSDGVLQLAPDGRVLSASPSCEALLGRSPQDLAGRSLYDLLHRADASELLGKARPGEPLPDKHHQRVRVMGRGGAVAVLHADTELVYSPITKALTEAVLVLRETTGG